MNPKENKITKGINYKTYKTQKTRRSGTLGGGAGFGREILANADV